MSVIRTAVELLFSKTAVDVTADISPDLLSFQYSDKEDGEADEISLTLKDPDHKWASTWKPDGGEMVRASILSGEMDGSIESIVTTIKNAIAGVFTRLPCGLFHIDSLRVAGSPSVMEMKGVSIPLDTPIRKKLKSKSWEKTTLKAIATAIAKDNKVGLLWDCEDDPQLDRKDQKRETDLKFLSTLCKENGCSIKVTDSQIVIFDQKSYEKKPSVKTFVLGFSDIISWDFESKQSETYKSVTVTYRDPRKKKRGSAGSRKTSNSTTATAGKNPAVNTYTYTDPNADENGQEYSLKKRATSIADAERLAKAKLRELNKRQVDGNMTVIGDVEIVAGVVITVLGFGSFDGRFIVEQANHSVSSSGYTTQMKLRRVNMEY